MESENAWYRLLRTPDGRIRLETHSPIDDLPPDAARRLAAELRPALEELHDVLSEEDGVAPTGEDGEISIVEARSSLLDRWARRAGGRSELPAEASSVVFTLLAAALEPDDAARRFIADWYLRTAQQNLRDRGADADERRRVFSALVQESWRMLRSALPPERALLLGARIERRVVRNLPEFGDAPPAALPVDTDSAR